LASVIVLDASVLIGHLDARDPHHSRARAMLEASGSEPLGASPISLAETLVAPARSGRLEVAREALGKLGVAELALGVDAPVELAELRASTSRKLPDCCVLLAARRCDGTVATFDSALAKAALAIGLAVVESGEGGIRTHEAG
jgi:predicted nucleic acid-binding protein